MEAYTSTGSPLPGSSLPGSPLPDQHITNSTNNTPYTPQRTTEEEKGKTTRANTAMSVIASLS
jgi:hypothetical protein